MHILVANPGSTSLKFKLCEFPAETIIAQGKIERIGEAVSPWQITAAGETRSGEQPVPDYTTGVRVISWDARSKGAARIRSPLEKIS